MSNIAMPSLTLLGSVWAMFDPGGVFLKLSLLFEPEGPRKQCAGVLFLPAQYIRRNCKRIEGGKALPNDRELPALTSLRSCEPFVDSDGLFLKLSIWLAPDSQRSETHISLLLPRRFIQANSMMLDRSRRGDDELVVDRIVDGLTAAVNVCVETHAQELRERVEHIERLAAQIKERS